MIIPDAATETVYRCRVCKKWWRSPAIAVSCCVIHSLGTCCHFGDTETTKP